MVSAFSSAAASKPSNQFVVEPDEEGAAAAFSEDDDRDDDFFLDAITAAVQTEIDRLNKEQEQLQVAHDSAIENLETLTACRGAGRFVHQPPLVPGGQATGGQDG